MIRLFLFYLLLINFIAFLIMYIDKKKAIKKQWRISEKTLFLIACSFGSLGIFIGMYTFRHKTKHFKFVFIIPIILFIQLTLIFLLM